MIGVLYVCLYIHRCVVVYTHVCSYMYMYIGVLVCHIVYMYTYVTYFVLGCVIGFNFGECQTGESVDDVILPQWAKGNARLFILKHRQVYIHVHVYCMLHVHVCTYMYMYVYIYMYNR